MNRLARGIQARLLAGAFVAAFFLVADLIRLAPLSTPAALSQFYLPGAVRLDTPELIWAAGILSFLSRLLAVTVLHLLAFAALGAVGVALFDRLDWPLNAGTGALYGLVAFSLAFYGALSLGKGEVIEGVPGIWSVAVATLLAGGIMGGFLQLSRAARRDT
ncbi:MAG: hypothetical protein JSU87_08895 [Gemmatimonadota bacterium]|nr:MAG: hypothetical protein JSU87_08895 [Gemmatimonadota bacterium]